MSKALSLPALKSLGELSEACPILVQDTREQIGLPFRRLPCEIGTCGEGDYQIAGVSDWAIELKGSLDELASCCTGHSRDRLEKEFFRLRPYRFKRLLIVGATREEDILTYIYRSRILPRCVLGSLFSWQSRFDIPYILVPTRERAARLIETLAFYHCKEVVQQANGLLRSYWRSAKVRVSAVGDIDAPSEPDAPPEPPEEFSPNKPNNQHT